MRSVNEIDRPAPSFCERPGFRCAPDLTQALEEFTEPQWSFTDGGRAEYDGFKPFTVAIPYDQWDDPKDLEGDEGCIPMESYAIWWRATFIGAVPDPFVADGFLAIYSVEDL